MARETSIRITQEVFSTPGNTTAHSVLPISDGRLKCFLNKRNNVPFENVLICTIEQIIYSIALEHYFPALAR